MFDELKDHVWQANLDLVRFGLVTMTFGNVSGCDRPKGVVAIKPSGVAYEEMRPADMVVLDLEGKVVEGRLRPSSDAPTHIALYKAFPKVGGIAHAHSEWATTFAQALQEIPCLGTTHADYFNGPVPLTRFLTDQEVVEDYEGNTGHVIVERFEGLDPLEMPAVLVAEHGPFTWGRSAAEAVANCLILEKIARIAWGTLALNPKAKPLPPALLNKHFERKHGPRAYYGQKKE